jgi:hypothetical protein
MSSKAKTAKAFLACVGISIAIGIVALVCFLFVALIIAMATGDISIGPCGFGPNQDPILIYIPIIGSVAVSGISYVLLRRRFEKSAKEKLSSPLADEN